ncbi:unnamed protein product [Peronospora destructor]|uniref:Uncharacterized protein n=1 Tax=Peronospora destructor TaxID=86335 RepID=A0AAV0TCE8_9STRA|nr:unnamed protein product [Peronospora destructor]
MPKRKANWWPSSILSDPDVLSVDDEGRFVLCKICHVHYAVHGGKKPKPVIMNSNFRTRAWDVHKERTNSHRLQKQQERLQQVKLSTQQGQVADTQGQQPTSEQAQQTTHRQQQTHEKAQSMPQSHTAVQTRLMAGIAGQTLTPLHAPLLVLPTLSANEVCQPPARLHSGTQVLQQRRQQQYQQQRQQQKQHQQGVKETKIAGLDRLKRAARDSDVKQPASASAQAVTVAIISGAASIHNGKRPASSMPVGVPSSRRRVFRAGLPGSSRQLVADLANHPYQKHLFTVPDTANHMVISKNAMAMERQADSSARWHHMHDDVSRALSPAPRRRLQGPASYTSGEICAAKTLAQTETGDLGGNNSEIVAKKLRSLNAEYHASNMRYADAYNMRQTDVLDRSSASYKEYWGTLRDVYTSSSTIDGGTRAVLHRKRHGGNSPAKSTQSKETEADSTTPDESGSSEDAFKPAVAVHDASLISAVESLADVISKQIANLYEKSATVSSREALAGLTSVMTDLRVLYGHAFERMIELQEKHLEVMKNILDINKSKVDSMLRQASEQANKRISYCRPSNASRASA